MDLQIFFDFYILVKLLGISFSIKVIFEAIQAGDAVRAEGVMREHSNAMVEYIEVFERRSADLTITDLISYTGYDLNNTTRMNDSGI